MQQLHYYIIAIIVATIEIRGSMIARKLHGIENKLLRNKIVQQTPTGNSSGKSKVECGISCSEELQCLSFFYRKNTGECRRYGEDFMEAMNTIVDNDWVYFHVFKDVPVSDTFCPTADGFQYNSIVGLCFKYFEIEETYENAMLNCKADNGYLIRIDRYVKQDIVAKYLDTITMNPNKMIRIGGYGSGPGWFYDENIPLTFYNWNRDDDQPEGQTGIALSRKANYMWHDISDHMKWPFICEIPSD